MRSERKFARRLVYNPAVQRLQLRSIGWRGLSLSVLLVCLLAAAPAQSVPSAAAAPQSRGEAQPKIEVNFLDPCRPAPADVEQMAHALAQVTESPHFSPDFEISRGRTTLTEAEARAVGVADSQGPMPSFWVRIRREFPAREPLTDVQYSLSVEAGSASEMLALHLRDYHDVLQVLLSDAVTGSASEVVKADTPPGRIRVERFGKSSIVLARCSGIDQSAYQPILQTADRIFARYRAAMAVKSVVPAELARLPLGKESGRNESKAAGRKHSPR
jgi:hypothetical protein